MWKRNSVLQSPDDGSGGGAPPAPAAPAPSGAPASAPAPSGAAPAAAPAGDPKADAYWPQDWRQTVSKADAKVLARLERYASPEAAMQALISAQNKISSGELKPVLGKNPTPEEMTEWRKAHGVPEAADKYDLGKDVKTDGIPDVLLKEVFSAAHATNQTPEQVAAVIKAWDKIAGSVAADQSDKDKATATAAEDALRTEWGPEYRRNVNLIHGLLDSNTSQPMKDTFLGARLPDGTKIGSSPDAMKLLVSLALIQNPTGVVVPASDGNQMQGVEDEIGKIEKTMRENRTAYNKDIKMQERLRSLYDAREKMKPRK